MREFERYVLVPFVERGRDASGWDCWGLVMTILREQAGVIVPDYPASPSDAPEVARMFRGGVDDTAHWVPVDHDDARRFDVAVMRGTTEIDGRIRRLPFHAGLFLSRDTVMHCEANLGTMTISTNSTEMRRRLVCIRRFVGLA